MSVATFQGDATRFGAVYERHVAEWLTDLGCTIVDRNHRHKSGIEFDILALLPTGETIGVECKASPDTATSPGMKRSDQRWKVMGLLHTLQHWKLRTGEAVRYVLITSHMPEAGTPQRRILDFAELVGDLQIIVVPSPRSRPPETGAGEVESTT